MHAAERNVAVFCYGTNVKSLTWKINKWREAIEIMGKETDRAILFCIFAHKNRQKAH